MAATTAPAAPHVCVFSDEELYERLRKVESLLEKRFGDVGKALEHERSWECGDDDSALFLEYRALKLLLAE